MENIMQDAFLLKHYEQIINKLYQILNTLITQREETNNKILILQEQLKQKDQKIKYFQQKIQSKQIFQSKALYQQKQNLVQVPLHIKSQPQIQKEYRSLSANNLLGNNLMQDKLNDPKKLDINKYFMSLLDFAQIVPLQVHQNNQTLNQKSKDSNRVSKVPPQINQRVAESQGKVIVNSKTQKIIHQTQNKQNKQNKQLKKTNHTSSVNSIFTLNHKQNKPLEYLSKKIEKIQNFLSNKDLTIRKKLNQNVLNHSNLINNKIKIRKNIIMNNHNVNNFVPQTS